MVGITETVLRDGHQSLIATRMRTKHMLPAAERLDSVGYRSLEVWGGATFDVCLRYLGENPWERLRALRRAMPKTALQMLLRGQNLVGYRPYSDDVVERFVRQAAEDGIAIFRIFDALNDPRNMESAIRAVKRTEARAQATICYTQSPVHTLAAFVDLGRHLAEMGADEICVKDMGGFMSPDDGAHLVSALVKEVGLPVVVHTHSSSGFSTLTCLACVDAGATAIDGALSPFAGGASQPPTETLVGALKSTPSDPRIDLGALADLAEYFRHVLDHYRGLLNVRALQTDPGVLLHQVPGGMLSNLLSQLKEQDASRTLPEVLAEIPRVRADLGYPPLVTPTSQIVGSQAVLNVLLGERYRELTREVRDYVRGVYGIPLGPIDPELARRVLAQEPSADQQAIHELGVEFERGLAELRALVPAADEAEVLSYIVFPDVYRAYVKAKSEDLTPEVLTAAALGIVGAMRRPSAPVLHGVSAPRNGSRWAQEGRRRLMRSRG